LQAAADKALFRVRLNKSLTARSAAQDIMASPLTARRAAQQDTMPPQRIFALPHLSAGAGGMHA